MDCCLQELSANPHYVIGVPMCLPVHTLVHLVHIEQKNTAHTSHKTPCANAPIPKCRKKSSPVILVASVPALTPIMAAAAPAPVPLVAAAKAPEAAAAKASTTHPTHTEGPTHPMGIVIKIVSITNCNQGRSCKEHPYCGEIIEEDVLVCLRCMQVIMPSTIGRPGQEVTAVALYWVANGINPCRMGFLPHHMASMPPVMMVCSPSCQRP